MCGIAGWFSSNESVVEKSGILEKMSLTLRRRGPDEHGEFADMNAAMLHRRLAVIDPETGKQPFIGENESGDKIVLVYNGEIYNTRELRRELRSQGFEFIGHSDTEVLMRSYLCWGEKCVEKLNGIFAFAVYDEGRRTIFTARDPIGVKPFFYYEYDGGFIFGSEIKTLLAHPLVKPRISEEGLYELFFIGPGRTPGCGVFDGIKELLPGECGVYGDGKFCRRKYFKLTASEHTHTKKQTLEYTRYLLTDAIERQLISDVPLCTFLSGGLDSSVISKVAADHFQKSGKTLDTYSVNYTDNAKFFKKSLFQPNSDEEFIELMKTEIGSNHREVVIDNNSLYNALFEAVHARDLPGMADVDSSLLLFCGEVKRDFTVAVSGECADELFGGYPWYHNEDLLYEESFPWSRSQEIRRSVLKSGLLPNGEEYVHARYEDTVKSADCLPDDSRLTRRMRQMFMLNFGWFMQTLLDRKDRMSMYSGLEVRVPFCDYRIVRYAYNMPWELKSLGGREKGIVRAAFADILPEKIVQRKKSPYPKTHNPVYFDLCAKGAMRVLEDKTSPLYELLDRNGVMRIIEDPDGISSPWYGQLMRAPQILAYIVQVYEWFKEYEVEMV